MGNLHLGRFFALTLAGICALSCGSKTPSSSIVIGSGGDAGVTDDPTKEAGAAKDAAAGAAGSNEAGTALVRPCEGEMLAPRAIVRLTFGQAKTSIGQMLGASALAAANKDDRNATPRYFDPLFDAAEGGVYDSALTERIDKIASATAHYVYEHPDTATPCGASPSVECAQTFVLDFAEKAFRRPLPDATRSSLLQVVASTLADGTPIEAIEDGVYAALMAPEFLYRFELGEASAAGETQLSPYEMASALSYFFYDGLPDAPLLASAQDGTISDPVVVAREVLRLLVSPNTKTKFEEVIGNGFYRERILGVVLDPAKAPDWNAGLSTSMRHEGDLFLGRVLWKGPVTDLLTSRTTFVNQALAKLYDATLNANLDADGYGEVELGPERSGIITQAGYLASQSYPDEASIVRRALTIDKDFLCEEQLAEPPLDSRSLQPVTATEKGKAQWRAGRPECSNCHNGFDPYGLALEGFDLIGKARKVDTNGSTIDTVVTLPPLLGSKMVANAAELSRAIADSGIYPRCLASRLMKSALEESPAELNQCTSRSVTDAYLGKPAPTLSAILKDIATSHVFRFRAQTP